MSKFVKWYRKCLFRAEVICSMHMIVRLFNLFDPCCSLPSSPRRVCLHGRYWAAWPSPKSIPDQNSSVPCAQVSVLVTLGVIVFDLSRGKTSALHFVYVECRITARVHVSPAYSPVAGVKLFVSLQQFFEHSRRVYKVVERCERSFVLGAKLRRGTLLRCRFSRSPTSNKNLYLNAGRLVSSDVAWKWEMSCRQRRCALTCVSLRELSGSYSLFINLFIIHINYLLFSQPISPKIICFIITVLGHKTVFIPNIFEAH